MCCLNHSKYPCQTVNNYIYSVVDFHLVINQHVVDHDIDDFVSFG